MTIIQPHKNNKRSNLLAAFLSLSTVVLSVLLIFLYNDLVNLKHEIESYDENIRKAEASSAELKNSLYSILDNKNLESLANESLILDKNPEYIKQEQLANN